MTRADLQANLAMVAWMIRFVARLAFWGGIAFTALRMEQLSAYGF
jgi:hypothetical protein